MGNLERQAATPLPSKWGAFKMIAYADQSTDRMPHIAMVHKDFNPEEPTYLRIHSECITGDLFGSRRCDCGEQLDVSMQMAARKGGVVLYLRQEGRGIGIINKLKAYNLQDQGFDTVDANLHLGLKEDGRHYAPAIKMMEDLGITSIRLITNNPLKVKAIQASNIEVVERVPIIIPSHKDNQGYLRTKEERMGHLF